jgi:hypothetical protein
MIRWPSAGRAAFGRPLQVQVLLRRFDRTGSGHDDGQLGAGS